MKFIVDRKTWYRGKGNGGSSLLRSDGKMCCIGFVGRQCGIPDKNLLGFAVVGRGLEHELFPIWMKPFSKSAIGEAYTTNDTIRLTESEREAKLKEIFLREGDEIEFQD
jgi:hypothetical protein